MRKSHKVRKRKQFPQLVKREVIHKQKNRCAICKRKLGQYGSDFHHANGDRSDNRLSNCKALCIPCHRRKHAE
ncbi:MAG: HNH endonuclease signature motif containing protein [Candidatus Nitrosopolaris sp.]